MDQKIGISEIKVTALARAKTNRRGHIGLGADSKLGGIAQALMHPCGDRLPHPTQGNTAKLRLRAGGRSRCHSSGSCRQCARGRRGRGAGGRAPPGPPPPVFPRDAPPPAPPNPPPPPPPPLRAHPPPASPHP